GLLLLLLLLFLGAGACTNAEWVTLADSLGAQTHHRPQTGFATSQPASSRRTTSTTRLVTDSALCPHTQRSSDMAADKGTSANDGAFTVADVDESVVDALLFNFPYTTRDELRALLAACSNNIDTAFSI